jgi:hypothetical protein
MEFVAANETPSAPTGSSTGNASSSSSSSNTNSNGETVQVQLPSDPSSSSSSSSGNTDGGDMRGVKSENFMVTMDTICVYGNILYLKSSCFIWLSVGEARLSHLDVSVPTKYDPMPLSTTLINESGSGNSDGSVCVGLMQRLAKRFGIQVFSSNNVAVEFEDSHGFLWQLIEKKLVELLAQRF